MEPRGSSPSASQSNETVFDTCRVLNEQISQIAKNLKHADPGDESSRESLLEQFASSSAKQIELLIQIRDGNEQQFKLLSESLSRAFEKLDESTQKTVWE